MAKLRRNHASRGGAAAGTTILKVSLFTAILCALTWGFRTFWAGTQVQTHPEYAGEAYFLPFGSRGQIVAHGGYTLSYFEDWEQAEWVAYILTGEHLRRPWTKRDNNFRRDPDVRSGSADGNDYRGSGYDRGHLVPFADFAWDAQLADETFFMSNVSPQDRGFNQGIWRELEELTRDWAGRFGRLYVVTGPVVTEEPLATIGRDERIAVPRTYYRVLLDLDRPEQKAIAFLLPNQTTDRPLTDFVVTVDRVEEVTGLDFFAELMPADLEAELEGSSTIDLWPLDRRKYDRRVEKWNNVR